MSLDNNLDNDGGGGGLPPIWLSRGREENRGVDGGRRVRLGPRTRWREFDHFSLPVALGGLDAFTQGAGIQPQAASAPGFTR